jgi:tungstate transport system ATP-binding protein
MSELLSIQRLCKAHAGVPLFDIESLVLDTASAYVLTGVNGAGKSTLLRVLAGLEAAHTQTAEWQGKPIQMAPYPRALRDAIVYVHQHPVLFSTSVAHNIGYGLVARGMPKVRIAHKVEEAMRWAGVEHLHAHDPAALSGGEKQRVALARAKVLDAKLLLLDEPTANLDGAAREQVIALIPTLVAAGGTVVMACHDRDLIGLPGVQRLKLRDGRMEKK